MLTQAPNPSPPFNPKHDKGNRLHSLCVTTRAADRDTQVLPKSYPTKSISSFLLIHLPYAGTSVGVAAAATAAALAFLAFIFSAHSRLAIRPLSAASALAFFAASSFSRLSLSRASFSIRFRPKTSLPFDIWAPPDGPPSEGARGAETVALGVDSSGKMDGRFVVVRPLMLTVVDESDTSRGWALFFGILRLPYPF